MSGQDDSSFRLSPRFLAVSGAVWGAAGAGFLYTAARVAEFPNPNEIPLFVPQTLLSASSALALSVSGLAFRDAWLARRHTVNAIDTARETLNLAK